MTPRREKGEGSIYQRHDHPTCPPLIDGERAEHKCKGRWASSIEDGYDRHGKRRRRVVTAKTRREVVDKLARIKREKAAGVTGDNLTVAQWVDLWHAQAERDLTPRTWHGYRGYLDRYVVPILGHHRLDALRAHHVSGMLRELDQGGLSASTRRQAYAVLRRALQLAADEQRVMENVAARVPRPKAEKNHHPALTVSQARQLLAACPSSADLARWMLALVVGMRQGEVLGLEWADVHLDDDPPWMLVHQQAQQIPRRGVVIREHTKTDRPRVIPLAGALEVVAQALRVHRTEHGGTGYVIGGPAGPVPPRRDWGLWKEALAACGLPDVPLHGARATAEQWMDEAGVPQQTRTDILGHATTQMTQTVYHRATMETMIAGLSKSRALD